MGAIEGSGGCFQAGQLLKIRQAKGLVAKGDALLAAHDYEGSVDQYQEAVREVQNIH